MDSDRRSAQVERLEMVDTDRRQRWSEDEKLMIVLESLATARPGRLFTYGKCANAWACRLRSRIIRRKNDQPCEGCGTLWNLRRISKELGAEGHLAGHTSNQGLAIVGSC